MNCERERQEAIIKVMMEQKTRKFGDIVASIRKNQNKPFEVAVFRVDPLTGDSKKNHGNQRYG